MAGSVPLTGHRPGQELLALAARVRPEQALVDPAGVPLHAASRDGLPDQGGGHQRSRARKDTLPR